MFKTMHPLLFWGLLATLLPSSPAQAGLCPDLTCQFLLCRSPAFGVPSSLWGELRPTDVGQLPPERDNTDLLPIGVMPSETEPQWLSLDIEGDTVFTAITYGLQVWDIAGANAPDPARLVVLGSNDFPFWSPAFTEEKRVVRDVDAPPGNDDVLAVALVNDNGLAVFDTTNRSSPIAKYGDKERNAHQVYSTHIGSSDYSFLATRDHGVTAYDLTIAKNLTTACIDDTPTQSSCGPYLGKIGSRTDVRYIDGVGDYLVFSSGDFAFGLEFYSVAKPSSPQFLFSALGLEHIHGVALWRNGSNYYLGLMSRDSFISNTTARIYDMSCMATASCTALGPLLWSQNLPASGSTHFVTYSQSDGRDFLSIGTINVCSQLTQSEWLYNVTNPSSPRDVTPADGLFNGQTTGYWGWYYRRNPTGFNSTAGLMGKFKGQYFYRAAFGIFDIHELGSGPPTASFTHSPAQLYQGELIDFAETSAGAPISFNWTFQDATPDSSSSPDPQGVVFNSTGLKNVSLDVSNAFGSDSTTQQLEVLDPDPTVISVTVAPNPALRCRPITFTVNGVAGLPPLTLDWTLQSAAGTVATGGNVNSFVWDSGSSADGQYTAAVTVTNSSGSAVATSPSLTLDPLPTLAFTSPGSAPETLNGPPFATGSVDFRIQSNGTTEWRWDFGDGTQPVWTSNPITGQRPSHTYTSAGTYSVTVEIRNCIVAALASSTTDVTITNTTPLIANFDAQGILCDEVSCFANTGEMVTFVDLSQGDPGFYDYDWRGDGLFFSTDNPAPVTVHTFYSPGTFTPQLTVRLGAGSDVFTHRQIIVSGGIHALPVISVDGPTYGETNQPLIYTATVPNCTPAPTTWQWDVSEAAIIGSATGSTITLSFSTLGAKTVRPKPIDGQYAGTQAVGVETAIVAHGSFVFADNFESNDLSAWSLTVP